MRCRTKPESQEDAAARQLVSQSAIVVRGRRTLAGLIIFDDGRRRASMQFHCERRRPIKRGSLLCILLALNFMRPGSADMNGHQGKLTNAMGPDLKSFQGFSSNMSEAIQRLVEVPTITRVTLDGTRATAHVSLNAKALAALANIVPQLLRICPEGNVCWKADLGGPCLGNTPVASAGFSLNGSFGQASFDYSDVLDAGTSFQAVAAYQGSLLCKAAASDNAGQPPPQGKFMRLTTSLTLTSTNAAATEVIFNVVLTNAVLDGQPIKARNVTIDYGDGSEVATVVTASDGSASAQHQYATSGFFNATASFQGDRRYQPSSVMDTVEIGPETSLTTLTVTPMSPIATEDATFVITLKSGGPDMSPVAGAAITVDFGDGTNGTGTTDLNGQFILTHTYAIASSFQVMASFAGDATYSKSSASTTLAIGLERASTSLAVTTRSPVATENITFAVVLRSDAPGMPPLAGKPITVSFGDGFSGNGTTDSTGSISVKHVYATAGTYQLSASFAGDATYYASSAATTIATGLETSSTSLSVAPMSPVATESATFLIALKSGGPGTPALSSKTVSVDFGDGATGTGVTDSTGQVSLTHTYNAAGSFSVVASFAGDATYSASSATIALAIGAEISTTNLAVTPNSRVATEGAIFEVAVKSGGPGMPPLVGKTITVDFGDTSSDTGITDGTGTVTLTHTYATAGNFQAVASFPGDTTYSASSATTNVVVLIETSSLSLTVTPMAPVATETATFVATLKSGGLGTPPVAGKAIFVVFGDGTTAQGNTSSDGTVSFSHIYSTANTFTTSATFSGDAAYSSSQVTTPVTVVCGTCTAPCGSFDYTNRIDGAISPFGYNKNTATFGQTFSPSRTSVLSAFSFNVNLPTDLYFKAYLYQWDDALSRATGPALYSSDVTATTMASRQVVTITLQQCVKVTAGVKYVIFFSSSGLWGQFGTQVSSGYIFIQSDVISSGALVGINNGNDTTQWTTASWSVLTIYDLSCAVSFI
ncbi:probable polycystin-1 [Coccomyxa sp. Obi]|nr:probable polycystin-1 [Coccomyxa sp. Obi]